jgi:DnaJ-domain-containing protein 1
VNLPGRLSRTTLGDLFGTLHRARATGVLELLERVGARAGTSHRVYFSSGLVDRIDTADDEPRLGELLLREGALDKEALRRLLLCLVEGSGRRTGEVVMSELSVSDAVVSAALKAQLRGRLDNVFRLSDAEVRFHVRRPPSRGGPVALLGPREFLHGRRRARGDGSTRPGSDKDDAYRVLGLTEGASAATVRQAFRRLASEHHPDRHPGASSEELATLVRRFSRISAAYHRLGS